MNTSSSLKRNAPALATIGALGAFALTGAFFGAAHMGLNPMFTSENSARHTLENNGFRPIEVGGYGWFSCGVGEHTDSLRTRFKAENPRGKVVTGTVCEGLVFSNPVLRLDD